MVRDVVRDVVHDVVVAVDGDVCLVYQLVYGSNFVVVPDLPSPASPALSAPSPALSARSPALTARSPVRLFKFFCVNGTYTHDFSCLFLRVYTLFYIFTNKICNGNRISHTTVSVLYRCGISYYDSINFIGCIFYTYVAFMFFNTHNILYNYIFIWIHKMLVNARSEFI
jgi:hypothetical protein